jgi:hypothetical protein
MRQKANLLTIKDPFGTFLDKRINVKVVQVGAFVLGMAISTKGFSTSLKTSISGSKAMMW